MKLAFIILAFFGIAIASLNAQIIVDPVTQQVVTDLLPHQYAAYASSVAIALMLGFRIWQARQNGKGWIEAIQAAFTGTNVPTKTPLILAGLCMLSLTSCAGLTAFIASPFGQASIVTAEALGKQLANAAEAKVIEQVILKSQAQIAVLNAQGVNANISKEIVRQSELLGLAGVVTAAQQQYTGMTGHAYMLPKDPLAAASLPVVSAASPPTP